MSRLSPSISITHTASDLAVQLQRQRLVPHREPFSSRADGVARHTDAASAHARKYQPCANPRQQQAAPQPQAQPQESTAGHFAGGSTNKKHALSRTKTQVAAHKRTHIFYCVALFITMLACSTLDFPPTSKGVFLFSGNPKGHWVPKFRFSFFFSWSPSNCYPFVITILINSAHTD